MTLVLTEEQEELRKVLRTFLAERSPEDEVRRLMATDDGYDPAVWQEMGQALGLQGLAIPEAFGGSGYTAIESMIVFEELGRALACTPYLSTVALASNALLLSEDDTAQRAYLPLLASGRSIGTVVIAETDGHRDEGAVAVHAVSDGDRHALFGHTSYVLDGMVADIIVVVAGRAAQGGTLFVVEGDAPGLTRTPLPTMDQTRKLARLDFDGAPARQIGPSGQGWQVMERVRDLAVVALAAEQVGGAQRCLEMAVEYAKTRVQFGRPIGSFQAIKHKCADMLVGVESARSAAYHAAGCAADHDADLRVAASLAKSYCSTAYVDAAAENIQIHGGVGFTWEHPAHLYFKRAKSSELLLGDPVSHRARLADLVLG